MTLLGAMFGAVIWCDPCGKWTQRGLMVFAIGVAIRPSFATLAGLDRAPASDRRMVGCVTCEAAESSSVYP
jgi:hypothetical protein